MAKRRKFSREFKREAVAMTEMEGATVRQVASDLGIGDGLLGRWRRELRRHGDKAYLGQGQARDGEIARLKRELARVRKERDFLQAAADVARAELAQAQSAESVARANLQQARPVLGLEEARLAKYSLYAPYDGLVTKRHRELGSAPSDQAKVFTVVDPETIWALPYIDEARAGAIETGHRRR